MSDFSRRKFLTNTPILAVGAVAGGTLDSKAAANSEPAGGATQRISLDGEWLFPADPNGTGEEKNWFRAGGFRRGRGPSKYHIHGKLKRRVLIIVT